MLKKFFRDRTAKRFKDVRRRRDLLNKRFAKANSEKAAIKRMTHLMESLPSRLNEIDIRIRDMQKIGNCSRSEKAQLTKELRGAIHIIDSVNRGMPGPETLKVLESNGFSEAKVRKAKLFYEQLITELKARVELIQKLN